MNNNEIRYCLCVCIALLTVATLQPQDASTASTNISPSTAQDIKPAATKPVPTASPTTTIVQSTTQNSNAQNVLPPTVVQTSPVQNSPTQQPSSETQTISSIQAQVTAPAAPVVTTAPIVQTTTTQTQMPVPPAPSATPAAQTPTQAPSTTVTTTTITTIPETQTVVPPVQTPAPVQQITSTPPVPQETMPASLPTQTEVAAPIPAPGTSGEPEKKSVSAIIPSQTTQPITQPEPAPQEVKPVQPPVPIQHEAQKSLETPVTVLPPSPAQKQAQSRLEDIVDDTEGKTEQEKSSADYAYLGKFLKPWELIDHDKLIEINFENAQLTNLISYFEKEYGLTFILDNVIEPTSPPAGTPDGGKSPVGIRFSFKTEKPLNKKQAWELFVSFLDMAGLMVIPGPVERVYQITNNNPASKLGTNKEPIPTFVGIDAALLPTSDVKIRYVYFIQNTTVDTVTSVVNKLRGPNSSAPILVNELNALILTDRASNIQTMLMILKELDKPVLPETLSVLRLKKTEAEKVKKLYDDLVNEEKNLFPRLAPWARKQSVGYFTENVRLVADKRTNTLIILGPRQNVKKIEDFITKEIDREIDLPYSPLHVYPLKFIDADATAKIINDLKAGFQSASTAGQIGGLIGGTRFIKPTVTITSEKSNNSLIINADYDDYLQIYELLEKIDIEQPQVAIRILVLDVTLSDNRKFGMQLRTPVPFMGNGTNVNFQNSGLPLTDTDNSQLVQRFDSTTNKASLLGDLINLVATQEPGSTILTLPADTFGVYGVLKALETITNVSVVAKPFLVTSHKYNASINIAETRRVTTSTVIGNAQTSQPAQGDLSAGLIISLTPQISPDDFVTLDISVENSQFDPGTASSATNNGNRNVKKVKSNVILGDNQVLALGGIIIDRELETTYKVPILGDIPLLGWFFKSKSKLKTKTSLLILVSAQIVRPQSQELINGFTKQRLDAAKEVLMRMENDDQGRDPLHRWFFNDRDKRFDNIMDSVLKTSPESDGQQKSESPKITIPEKVIIPEKEQQPQTEAQAPASNPQKDPVIATGTTQNNEKQVAEEQLAPSTAEETEEPQKAEEAVVPAQQSKPEQPTQRTSARRRLRQFIPSTGGAGAS